ncbi:hypothetical protein FQZ97_601800 [compost metagenome]
MMAATCSGSMSALNSLSMARSESSTDTPCSAIGAGTWKMLPGKGPKPVLYGTTLPVSAMPMKVRP